MMINLRPYNELSHSHRAQRQEPETHHSEAALLSALTTAPSSFLTFLCNGARCGCKASTELIANRDSERRAYLKQTGLNSVQSDVVSDSVIHRRDNEELCDGWL